MWSRLLACKRHRGRGTGGTGTGTGTGTGSAAPLERTLPRAVIRWAFSFLAARDLCVLLRVSRSIAAAASDEQLWRVHLVRTGHLCGGCTDERGGRFRRALLAHLATAAHWLCPPYSQYDAYTAQDIRLQRTPTVLLSEEVHLLVCLSPETGALSVYSLELRRPSAQPPPPLLEWRPAPVCVRVSGFRLVAGWAVEAVCRCWQFHRGGAPLWTSAQFPASITCVDTRLDLVAVGLSSGWVHILCAATGATRASWRTSSGAGGPAVTEIRFDLWAHAVAYVAGHPQFIGVRHRLFWEPESALDSNWTPQRRWRWQQKRMRQRQRQQHPLLAVDMRLGHLRWSATGNELAVTATADADVDEGGDDNSAVWILQIGGERRRQPSTLGAPAFATMWLDADKVVGQHEGSLWVFDRRSGRSHTLGEGGGSARRLTDGTHVVEYRSDGQGVRILDLSRPRPSLLLLRLPRFGRG